MNINTVKEYLDDQNVKYLTIIHSRAYTAQETAASAAVPGREMAKTVMVKVDGRMAMAVLPAPFQIDFSLLTKSLGAKEVTLATEDEFANMFPDCEVGAMPPFGNLYGMDVYADVRLTNDENIVFHAGTLTELMKMNYQDYELLVKPSIHGFSMLPRQKLRVA